jgi:MFS family permease
MLKHPPQFAGLPCATGLHPNGGWDFHAYALISRSIWRLGMAATEGDLRRFSSAASWRTPLVIVVCGCLIGMLTFGPRSTFGFFMQPMSREFSWGRDVFGLAVAIQNLLWGIGQPIAGAIADRFGNVKVVSVGGLLYAAGLLLMSQSATPLSLNLSAGVLIGFGLSGCSFNLVLSAFGKLIPPEWRGVALGAGTAAGSFGQFIFAPFGVALLDHFGWQTALGVFAGMMLLVVPLSMALAAPPAKANSAVVPDQQTFRHALAEAFGHRSYVLLVLGFFTCGFQLAFTTVHLPAYLVDRGVPVQLGGWVIATIGLFNIVGSLSVGWLQNRLPKRYILSAIYFIRAIAIAAFISFPVTGFSAIAFGIVTGLTWLSTVPPTSSLVALMFGTRWLATLYGFAFFSHQVGGFLGVWLGGIVFDKFSSYTPIWWLSILFGVLSGLINMPIVEAPVRRPAAQPA